MADQLDQENLQSDDKSNQSSRWEQKVLEKLAMAAVQEQKRSRRWGIFFKSLTFVYLTFLLVAIIGPLKNQAMNEGDTPLTAVIDVSGVISDGEEASADVIIEGLRAAAENPATEGIILKMNTPGGSPVQSAYVYDEIIRLKQLYKDLPIYAVVSDICASGGYFIAAATDKIFVNRSSMIGSIGVLMDGFGFVNSMEKMGVERRLLTAGEHKGLLDPFSPEKPEEVEHIKTLLADVHQSFIDAVKEGRGSRLTDDPKLFTGLIWTGSEGVKLGLADGFGSVDSVARDIIGAEKIVNFTPKERLIDRLVSQVSATTDLFKTFGGIMNGATLR